jgi:signal transduction histidine kinase
MLRDFISAHREEILTRAWQRVRSRNAPVAADARMKEGLPLFLDLLDEALRRSTAQEVADQVSIGVSGSAHGGALFLEGVTVAQVVHNYGDLCQVITALSAEHDTPIATDEFKILNLCLDDAIASAVTEYARLHDKVLADQGTERLGVLAHEMRNQLNAAMLSFASIRKGIVAPGGSTGAMHERSLMRLQGLIDRSLADVRLDHGMQQLERVAVWELFEEIQIGALMFAQARGVKLTVAAVDHEIVVEADRQSLIAAIANLLQNAFKFTRDGGTVDLRLTTTTTRVLIDIEDECGGLPPGKAEDLFLPFEQQGRDRSGLGLGLSICMKAVRAMSGELRVRDLPGKGCIFTLDLPKQPPPPTPIRAPKRSVEKKEAERPAGSKARSG